MPIPLLLPVFPEPLVAEGPALQVPAIPADAERGNVGAHEVVEVRTLVDGVEVFHGGTSVRSVGGRVAQVVVRAPDLRIAERGFPPEGSRVWFPTPRGLVAAGWTSGDGVEHVVAGDGRVLFHRAPPAASGVLSGTHHERAPNGPVTTSPLDGVRVVTPDGEGITDASGAWTAPGDGAVVTLAGPWFTVVDRQGAPLEVGLLGGDELLDDPADASELDAFVAATRARAAWAPFAPDNEWIAGSVELHVDQALAACNAYYWGWALHFYRPVPSCWPTAQHADVVAHEWGHGLHDHTRVGPFDGALSEGVADVVAWRLSGDEVIARGLFKDGAGMRDLSEVRRYPDDVDDTLPHETGRIVSGALVALSTAWDDEPAGTFEGWFLRFLLTGPTMESAWDDARFADDDDGDLGNGTPRGCDLARSFGPHGYGPLQDGWGAVRVDHEPPTAAAPGAPIALEVTVSTGFDACVQVDGGLVATFRVSGGEQAQVPLAGDTLVVGELPGAPAGALVEWRIGGEVADAAVTLPGDDGWYTVTVDEAAPEPSDTGAADTGTVEATTYDGSAGPEGCGCGHAGSSGWVSLIGVAAALSRRSSGRARWR